VRELLTISRSDACAGTSRCVAALLSAHEGNRAAALMHLHRAEELLPAAAPIGDMLADTQIRVSLALGDPVDALDRIARHMATAVRIDLTAADEWLELASEAAADLTERPASSPEREDALVRLDHIEATRGTDPPPFAPAGTRDVIRPALGALHAAHRAQCAGDDAALDNLWTAACEATLAADLRYEHARALHRLARHLLTHRVDRRRATSALVEARSIAVGLGAAPLVDDIDALVGQVHVQLPRTQPGEDAVRPAHPSLSTDPPLTHREREILGGLLSGETYAQIAARLFISEKTVSSHVSNLLRKTGTTSRIELADLARRSEERRRPI
jgi:DNA-binding CsgD family transcriptional regulator